MSLSISRRREACLKYLQNDFDTDRTIAWVLKEFANESAFQNATHKDRLARNIITMGGSGDQQQLNCVAFQQALSQHVEAILDRRNAEDRKALIDVREQNKTLNARNSELHQRVDQLNGELRDLMSRAHEAEQLQIGAGSA